MAKIKSITLKNIKFFGESQTIPINSKHVLLFGENGSGKSSLYWALYRILASANKLELAEIEKYFVPNGEFSWLNANQVQEGNNEAELSLVLDDGQSFTLTHIDFSINANQAAKESNYASEFMNYKFLFKIHDFSHTEDINLFEVFHLQLFPYIRFSPVTYWRRNNTTKKVEEYEATSALQIYNFVKNGPRKNYPDRQGRNIHPPEKSQQYLDYKNIVNGFETSMQNLMTLINSIGNPILKDDLGYDIQFELVFKKQKSFWLTPQYFNPPEYVIELKIPVYYGIPNIVKKPHSFLNEAKLTAVGLAIRLAVLQQRLQTAELKILVLDDLLISLDMSNRRKVLDLFLNKYAENYQLFILTHDRGFFEKTKRQVYAMGKSEEWLNLEMYEDTRSSPSKPFIKKSESFIENATKHFLEFEFPAAANSLRKACEQLLDELLPAHYKLTEEGQPIWQLDNLLAKAEVYYKTFPVEYKPVVELREHLKILLNPLSHSDLESPIYKNELKEVFDSYENLLKYKQLSTHKLLDSGEKLVFSLRDNSSNNDLSWEIELLEDLNYSQIPAFAPMLSFCKFRCFWSINNQRQIKPIMGEELIEFYKDACKKTQNKPIDIWQVLAKSDGNRSLKDIIDKSDISPTTNPQKHEPKTT